MQNIFREFAWKMLCSIEIILNKFIKLYFFIKVQHTGDTDLGQAEVHLSFRLRCTKSKY